jgi:hypothetical protein
MTFSVDQSVVIKYVYVSLVIGFHDTVYCARLNLKFGIDLTKFSLSLTK